MKKILYITSQYDVLNSSATIRNNSLVKGFIENGCLVDVYTVRWPEDMRSPFFMREKNGNIFYSEIPAISFNNRLKHSLKFKSTIFSYIKKAVKDILYFPDLCAKWKDIIRVNNLDQYELMITSSDFKSSHMVGENLREHTQSLKWVQIWGDPWSTDINTPFYLKPVTRIKEKNLIKKCDFVVYVSEPTTVEMMRKYPSFAEKIHFIPRGYYFKIIKKINPGIKYPVHITYTGTVGLGRNMKNIVESVNLYNTYHKQNRIIIDFYSNITDELLKYNVYDCVVFHNTVDFENMKDVYERSDILLFVSNCSSTTQIPGKLFDYLGTNLPILCLVNNKTDAVFNFINRHKQCIIVNNTKDSIVNFMDEILASQKNIYSTEERYSPNSIAISIINMVDNSYNQ